MTYRTFDGTSQVETITDGRFSSDGTQNLKDFEYINIGTGKDLSFYHDGSDSRIENTTGDIKLKNAGSYYFFDEDGGETLASFINDGAINLYYNNSKKFETTTTGISVTGAVTATGGFNATTASNSTSLVFSADTDNNETGSFNFVDFKIDGSIHANIFVDQPSSGSGDFEINTHADVANITKIGNGTGDTRRVQINSDSLQIVTTRTPASDATGAAGQIAWDANYVYVCTATDTWKRAALTGGY